MELTKKARPSKPQAQEGTHLRFFWNTKVFWLFQYPESFISTMEKEALFNAKKEIFPPRCIFVNQVTIVVWVCIHILYSALLMKWSLLSAGESSEFSPFDNILAISFSCLFLICALYSTELFFLLVLSFLFIFAFLTFFFCSIF